MIKNNLNTLVLSGGGIKGIAYIGVIKYLQENNILKNINKFIGTSIGAFFSILLIIGYTYENLLDFIILFDLTNLNKKNINNLLSLFGIDSGKHFLIVLENMFISKKFDVNITMKELFDITKKELIVSGVCLNDRKCHYFSHVTHPNIKVITAIRISISIPIIFVPVEYNNKLWVDGALMDNYPIHLCKSHLNTVLGVYLNDKFESSSIDNYEDYFLSIIQCLINGVSDNLIDNYKLNTINIDLKINMLEEKININNIMDIINKGYEEINLFFL
jgi:predicted acylesterase/phospholipase RssA